MIPSAKAWRHTVTAEQRSVVRNDGTNLGNMSVLLSDTPPGSRSLSHIVNLEEVGMESEEIPSSMQSHSSVRMHDL